MKKIKKYATFILENYKSDENIEKEFVDMSIQEIKFETRDMSYMYNANTFEGFVVFDFPYGDESVGGGSDSTNEYFVYNTISNTFQFRVDNWYPDNTYNQMVKMISYELNKKYHADFKYVNSNEFGDLNGYKQ